MASEKTRAFSEYQSASDETPNSLVSALRRGSETAWSQLAQIWGKTIYQFCRSRRLRHEDCEEIVQAVLVKMYRYISQFQRDGQSTRLRYWVYSIVRREIATHCTRYLAKPGSAGGDAFQRILNELQSSPDMEDAQVVFRDQLVNNVLQVIKADFEPQVWLAFELFSMEGLEGSVVAARLGTNSNAVRQAAHRVRTRLRNELEGVLCDHREKPDCIGNRS